MKKILNNDWWPLLKDEFESDYYTKLRNYLKKEYNSHIIYPNMFDIFNALQMTPYSQVKVVILGQDPYHGPEQAHGLCFSVNKEVAQPPSLRNIFQELKLDCGCIMPPHGCLTSWAQQGVLLLNTVLTVRQHQPTSHRNIGWETFTDKIITLLNEHPNPVVYLLWGNHARSKKSLITNNSHLILEAPHPSPLSASRGFFGCKHFSRTNYFLKSNNIEPINWCIT